MKCAVGCKTNQKSFVRERPAAAVEATWEELLGKVRKAKAQAWGAPNNSFEYWVQAQPYSTHRRSERMPR